MTELVACGLTAPSLLGFSLPDRSEAGHSDSGLRDLARRLHLGRDAWWQLAPFLAFDPRHYRRVRLWRDAEWEALLLCWLPGQHTMIHDHGGSVGVSAVLMGTLHESRYGLAGGALRPLGCADVSAGSATLELRDTIHEVANESAAPAASLHLYSPPLRVLGAWDPGGTRREVDVADSPAVQVGGNPALPA